MSDYVEQAFPKWKYGPDHSSQMVLDADAERALGPGWYDTPTAAAAAKRASREQLENQARREQQEGQHKPQAAKLVEEKARSNGSEGANRSDARRRTEGRTTMNSRGNAGPQPPRRLLRLKAASIYLSMSQWRLRRLIWEGRIPTVQPQEGSPFLLDIRDLDYFVEHSKRTTPL